MTKKQKIELVIPSQISRIRQVEEKAEEIARGIGFSEDECDSLAIAVTEVIANAINHGNKRDKKKHVHIAFVTQNKSLEIHVRDEGEGFNPEEVANPLDPENLLKDSGRGIFIVNTLMDKVQFKFHENGTEVILTKKHK